MLSGIELVTIVAGSQSLERKGDTVNVTLRFRDHKNHTWIKTPFEGEYVENISFSVEVAQGWHPLYKKILPR